MSLSLRTIDDLTDDDFSIDPLAAAGITTVNTMNPSAQTSNDALFATGAIAPMIPLAETGQPTNTTAAPQNDAMATANAAPANATGSIQTDEAEDAKSKIFRVVGTTRLIRAGTKSAASKFAGSKVEVREADCNDVIELFDQANPPAVIGELEGKGKVFVHTSGDTKRLVRGNKASEVSKLLSPEIKLEVLSAEDLLEALSGGAAIEVAA